MAGRPADVEAQVASVADALAGQLPEKRADNLLVATWNLRAFGGLTPTWQPKPRMSPKRDWTAVALIATVLARFDVIAVQEVKRDTTALRRLMVELGPDWRFITSDVTEGVPGNEERLTFLYDTTRVLPSGLVGEIVLPSTSNNANQFARTPYAASFSRGPVDFILTTVHIVWGHNPTERIPEIAAFAAWMRRWADRAQDWNQNLLVLGDFNIDNKDSPLFAAVSDTGLGPPAELDQISRTIFDDPPCPALLRPDRLVLHPEAAVRQPADRDRVPRPLRVVRLHPPRLPRHEEDRHLLAHLRPLSALGRIRTLRLNGQSTPVRTPR